MRQFFSIILHSKTCQRLQNIVLEPKITNLTRYAMKKILSFVILCSTIVGALAYVEDITVNQLCNGSHLVEICYTAFSTHDSIIAINVQSTLPSTDDWTVPMLTLFDTISTYSTMHNLGWRVPASSAGVRHCFLWDTGTDLGTPEMCDYRLRIAVFDSILNIFSLADSFRVCDSLIDPTVKAFGLEYKDGKLWVLFHEDITHDCWLKPYTLPSLTPGDSIFIGHVAVGPSDMTFAGNRMFWIDDTRVLLNEFHFDTRTSSVARGDWWGLPGTMEHLSGACFDGTKMWLSFSSGTFVAIDTHSFALIDTMFFPSFGVSVPATSSDGLAWGLGLLWCYSNDNKVYVIDTETKTIVHEIPTGDIIDIRGAEGCTWDGVNIWVIDYARGHCYKLSLFAQISFFGNLAYCIDNYPPRISWLSPYCPDLTDTFYARDTVELAWEFFDANPRNGHSSITLYDRMVFEGISDITNCEWTVYPWVNWSGNFELTVVDSLGNAATRNSCMFYITNPTGISGSYVSRSHSARVFPNPFNSACRIEGIESGNCAIFSMDGRLVRDIEVKNGVFEWDATDNAGERVVQGVYLLCSVRSNIREHLATLFFVE